VSCEYEDCREPFGLPVVVFEDEDGREVTYCLYDFLVYVKGFDAIEAAEIALDD
jgi:hypothetical protein